MILTARIGEAKNPGPIIGTTNPCGALGKAAMYAELPGEGRVPAVWGIAESHLTKHGLARFRQELVHQQAKWRIVHGAHAPPLSNVPGTLGGKATGTAILSNCPIRQMTSDWEPEAWATGRFQVAAVHVETQWLKIGSFYGYARDAHTKAVKGKTDTLLQNLTERIVLQSRGLRALVGDFNATTADLGQFEVWRKHGFRELQEIAKTRWSQDIQNTCKGKSVKDHVWVSSELAELLTEVKVSTEFFPDHAIVYGVFRPFGSHVPTTIWYKPHQLPWEDIPVDHVWDEAPLPASIPEVFASMEAQVDRTLRSQGKPGLQRNQKGRCAVTEPTTIRHPITPVKPSRKGEYVITYLGESFHHTKWVRQLRRFQSLAKLLQKPPQNEGTRNHVHQLWKAIRGAAGFPGGFPHAWLQRAVVMPGTPWQLPKQVPSLEIAQAIFLNFQCEFRLLEKQLNQHRRATAKARRVDDPNVIFRDVAKPRSMPVQTVVTKTVANVVSVSEDGLTINYEPADLDTQQEVESSHGWLQLKSHRPGVLEMEAESALEVGDQITQQTMRGGIKQIFHAFADLWKPMWKKHADTPPDRWDEFVGRLKSEVPKPDEALQLPPITTEQWIKAVRAKKAKTATGPDGVSRMDLLRMPPSLCSALVGRINMIDQGVHQWPAPLLVGHITSVEKSENACAPKDFRPITVLTLPYRTWSSIRARQCLRFLDRVAHAGVKGNRPQQGTLSIWWQISSEIEASIFQDEPLSGFVTDVCKAFNNLSRPVVYACAIHFGLPLAFIRTWHTAVAGVTRHFVVQGSTSEPIRGDTGYPEGDPLSVVAMMLMNMAMHHMLAFQVPEACTLSFVDNWECKATCSAAVNRTFCAMEQFAAMVDVQLDSAKSHFWAVTAADRKYLTACNRKVIHHGADLGGHLNYTKRFTNYTLQARISKTRVLWDHLRRSSAPQEQKLRMTFTVAWPRCLHGIAGTSLGMEHLGKLRSSLMQSMGWNKKGASPILQGLLMHPRCDPWYYTLWETLSVFRTQCTPDATFPVLTGLVLNPPAHVNPGPAGVFLARLHSLGWKWDHHGFIVDHEGFRWHIIDSPVQLVKMRLQHAWAAAMGALVSQRKEFHGMCTVDTITSRSTQKSFALDGAGILRTAMNGTLYTRNKQIHAGKVPSKTCPHCELEDSVEHRLSQCEGFADLRAAVSEATWQFVGLQPECTRLHGWFVESACDRLFREALHNLPDTTGSFEHVPQVPDTLHLFTDGSCRHPTKPVIRTATWGVSLALLPEERFFPIAAGSVMGMCQTVLRGEILAAISACRCGLLYKRPFYLWVDNELVYKRIRAWTQNEGKVPTSRNNDHDLWQKLWTLVRTSVSRGFFQQVVKVTSHQRVGGGNFVEEWARRGNESADRTAGDAFQQWPASCVRLAKKMEELYQQRHFACQEFHNMLVQCGLRDVESKAVSADHDEQRWEQETRKGDNRDAPVSLDGIQRLIVPTDPQHLGECLQPLHAWLTALTTAEDAMPIWLSSYQLLMHYQSTTGSMGFEYRRKGRLWLLVQDPNTQFGFLQLATWLQSLIRNYATFFGIHADTQLQLPWGSSFRSWQRCLHLRASTAQFARIDQTLRRRGIAGIKKISVLGQLGQFRLD